MIRELHYADLSDILSWRNSTIVRENMFNRDLISWEQHINWFEKSKNDKNKIMVVCLNNGSLIGYVGMTKLFGGEVVEWSFHVNPNAPRGSGTQTCKEAISYAQKCGIFKISGQVLSFNEKSISLHNRLGFKLEGVLEKQYFDGKKYHDILCFGFFLREEYYA